MVFDRFNYQLPQPERNEGRIQAAFAIICHAFGQNFNFLSSITKSLPQFVSIVCICSHNEKEDFKKSKEVL